MVTFQSIWVKDRKRAPSCLIILEQKKLKDRHGMVEVLDRSAYFNCCTGVLNEEAHSRTYLMQRWMKDLYKRKENEEKHQSSDR